MAWNVLERLKSWFRRTKTAGESSEVNTDDPVSEEADSSLFYCESCEVTFISRELETCPRCDRMIEEIESEREMDSFHLH